MLLSKWLFLRRMERRIADVVRIASVTTFGDIDPPEVEFDIDPLFGTPERNIAEFGASLILYVLGQQGLSLQIDYGKNELWMNTDEGAIELLPVPAPLLVDLSRRLVECMNGRHIAGTAQRILRLPDRRELTIIFAPRSSGSLAPLGLIISGFRAGAGKGKGDITEWVGKGAGQGDITDYWG